MAAVFYISERRERSREREIERKIEKEREAPLVYVFVVSCPSQPNCHND